MSEIDPAGGTVLVVDDDPMMRALSRRVLQRAGYVVKEATSGTDAVALFAVEPCDLVVLDVMMPGMDGFDTCRALRSLQGGESTPVLMVTGLDDVDSIQKAYQVGATAFIPKPLNYLVMGHTVRYMMRSRRVVAELRRTVGELEQARSHIAELANFDYLTGLPNRRFLKDHLRYVLEHSRRYGRSAALLSIDLDLFKKINDTMGHSVGDQVLQAVGQRLKGCLRKSDFVIRGDEDSVDSSGVGDTVARLGGDEFVVVLAEVRSSEDIFMVASRMQGELCRAIETDAGEVFVTGSVGITIFPDNGDSAEELIRNADAAMYHAKTRGGANCQFYSRSLNESARKRVWMDAELRHALDRGELLLHYQPRIDARTGKMSGVEALARWQHRDRGLVSPGEFIPFAEESGLIVDIGRWVLEEACRQQVAWQTAGLSPLVVSVNVSPRQLRDEGFLLQLERTLQETGIDPGLLELEITEGLLLDPSPHTGSILRAIKELGVSLALDDFGTGYSSLSYLARYPLDTLKIDRSFASDVTSNPQNAAIVTAIIALGQSLGMTVVAEGVETAEQFALLRSQGCDEAQGYLFSRPVVAEEIAGRFAGDEAPFDVANLGATVIH